MRKTRQPQKPHAFRLGLFTAKISSWIHGAFEEIIIHHHPDSKLYYTRGTSRFCPFCNSVLTHPTWKQSKCPNCGLFDRDYLEAVSGLVRTNIKHKKGEPWAVVKDVFSQDIEAKLQKQASIQLQSSKMIRGLPSEHIVPKPVRPECAVLSPEGLSVIDSGIAAVMQENRNEAFDLRVIGSEMTESGNDANSKVERHSVCLST